MKNRISLLLLLIIISATYKSFGQNVDILILKFAPLSLLDPFGENVHIGSEFNLNGPFSIEADLATYVQIFDSPRIKDRLGFKFKPEIRYYLTSKKRKTSDCGGFYIANELYFIFDKFKRGDTFRHYDQTLDTNYLYHDYERIRRFIIGDNFKIGYQAVTKIKLTFDYYFGLGLKYYKGSYDYKVNDPICCNVMRPFEIAVDKGIKPDMTFGIKVGYVLEK